MPNVSDYIGQSYQRYSVGARWTVPEDAKPPFHPGLVEDDRGVVFYLRPDGELVDVAGALSTQVRGGLATVRTDSNGQATVVFPEPFPVPPLSIVTTPRNQMVLTGTLVLTETQVIVWAWNTLTNVWFANQDLDLYWIGLFA